MKRIILCLSLFTFFGSQAQQINPVPDYVFSNKMSVGRNAVTDTAAYFSIGPRYNAIRGMMPPMVTDTASVSGTKRNGLLIFSIQKNKYLYWDSVGVKWAEMAGTGGSAITGSGVAGYMPKFTTTTNIANSNIYNSSGRVAINHTSPANPLHIYSDTASEVLRLEYKNTAPYISFYQKTTRLGYLQFDSAFGGLIQDETNMPLRFATSSTERMRIKADGELLLNTTSDAGNYQLQVAGSIYNTTGAVFAASSGNVGIGVTNPGYKLDLGSSNDAYARFWFSNSGFIGSGNDVAGFQIRTISSTTNGVRFINYAANQEYARFNSDGELVINTTTDAGAYALQVAGAIYNTTTITTGAPSGGTAKPFKIGAAATVSPTSPNRTIEIEIDGTTYYLHAKTTND